MFSKVVLLIAATLAAFVAATPVPTGSAQCNTGPVQCCDKVYQSQTFEASFLASLVGATLQNLAASVGTQCSPITAIGAGSGAQWYVSLWLPS